MRHAQALIFAVALAAGAAPVARPAVAVAAEPAHFAVMGVRLYMSAPEVLTSLYAQGVHEDAVSEHVHPCALHAAAACTDTITARLADGPITVRFTDSPAGFNEGREAAYSITYKLVRSSADAAAIRGVAEERFGPLSDATDGAWCAGPATAKCSESDPRMAYGRGGDGAGELALTDLGLPVRLAAGAPKQ